MSLVIDLILVLIIVISIIVGYKRGFADRALGLLSGVAAFIIAFLTAPKLQQFIYERFVFNRLTVFISEKLSALAEGSNFKNLLEEGAANESLKAFLANIGVNYDSVCEQISSGGAAESISQNISEPVARIAAYALAFIIIFLGALLALFLIRLIFKALVKLPVLKTADKVLGVIFGAVIGIAVVWVISIALKMSLPYLTALWPQLFPEDLFETSYILRLFYDVNALKDIFDYKKILNTGLLLR